MQLTSSWIRRLSRRIFVEWDRLRDACDACSRRDFITSRTATITELEQPEDRKLGSCFDFIVLIGLIYFQNTSRKNGLGKKRESIKVTQLSALSAPHTNQFQCVLMLRAFPVTGKQTHWVGDATSNSLVLENDVMQTRRCFELDCQAILQMELTGDQYEIIHEAETGIADPSCSILLFLQKTDIF